MRFRPLALARFLSSDHSRHLAETIATKRHPRVSEVLEPIRVQTQSEAAFEVRMWSGASVQVSLLRQAVQVEREPHVPHSTETYLMINLDAIEIESVHHFMKLS